MSETLKGKIDDATRDRLNKNELLAVAAERGVVGVDEGNTKAEIQAAINAQEAPSAADDAADDRALARGENLDKGKPPSAAEVLKAQAQASKDFATKAQEAADAAIRQGSASANAQFQPPEGQKPAYVRAGQLVSPDGKKATERNLALDEEDDDTSPMVVPNVEAVARTPQAEQ